MAFARYDNAVSRLRAQSRVAAVATSQTKVEFAVDAVTWR
jgi:hypothetical protein